MTIINKVPNEIILAGILVLSVFPEEHKGTLFCENLLLEKRLPVDTRAIKSVSPSSSGYNKEKIGFPLEYVHSEPYFQQLFRGEPRRTLLFEN
jgi:hypothetical protein